MKSKINLIVFLASLPLVLSCSPSDTKDSCGPATSLQGAIDNLPETQKIEFKNWEKSLFKKCELGSIFPSLSAPLDEKAADQVDVKRFLEATNNSIIISNEKDPSEFIVFSGVSTYSQPVNSKAFSCDHTQGKAAVEVKTSGSHCEVKIGGQLVYATDLTPQISVALHTSREKSQSISSIPQQIAAGERTAGGGFVSLRTSAFVDPVTQVLGTNDIVKPDPDPSKPPTTVYPTRQRIYDLLLNNFSGLQPNQIETYFPSNGNAAYNTMWAQLTEKSAEDLGKLIIFSNNQPHLIGASSVGLGNLWDGGIFNQKSFAVSFVWSAPVPRISSGGLNNETDPKYLEFEVDVNFEGNVKDGGKSKITDVILSEPKRKDSAEMFRECALGRNSGLSAIYKTNKEQPLVPYYEVISPCGPIVSEEHVIKSIFNDVTLRKAFLETIGSAKLPEAGYSDSYRAWGGLFSEFLKLIPLQTNNFLTEMDAPVSLKKKLSLTQKQIDLLLENVPLGTNSYDIRLATVDAATRWVFYKILVDENTINDLKKVIDRFSVDFKVSTLELLLSMGNRDMERNFSSAIKYALSLDDEFLKQYKTLRSKAQVMGAQSVFTSFEINFFFRRQKTDFLADWERVIDLAHQSAVKAKTERSKVRDKVSDGDFESTRTAILELSIGEGWKPLTFSNFEKMVSLAKFIPRCRGLVDAISLASCAGGASRFKTADDGLLSPRHRDYHLELLAKLESKLPEISRYQPQVTELIVQSFYNPLWAGCSDREIAVRKVAFHHLFDDVVSGKITFTNGMGDLETVLKGCQY